jgi:hypothetical protein
MVRRSGERSRSEYGTAEHDCAKVDQAKRDGAECENEGVHEEK